MKFLGDILQEIKQIGRIAWGLYTKSIHKPNILSWDKYQSMQTKITLLIEQFLFDFFSFLEAMISQNSKEESTANTSDLSYLIVFKTNYFQVTLRNLKIKNSCLPMW